uniref:Uncharacterized protein n=1 Tax=Amphimedon queenslandica TaxID=400682 RepID=A0A1X7VM36_AMPQE
MDKDYRVFSSESLLYGNDETFNHRIRFKSIMIYKCLFSDDTCDTTLLYSMIAAGACAMEKKLNTYAEAQLPGGIYWNPEPEIQEILRQLEPSNDICESILGHNDYLSTAVPNLCQKSRSNLIEVKKNNTIKWLDALPEQEQDKVLDLAMEHRVTVAKERKKEKEECSERRREQIRKDHNRKVALLRKAQDEKDKLSNLHLITTSQELYQFIEFIDKEDCLHKKKAKKCALLREQISIRNKYWIKTYTSFSPMQDNSVQWKR